MDRLKLIAVGDLVWVMDDNGALKLITVDAIVYNDDPDLHGWDIECEGQLYWVECCYFLEYPIVEN